MNLLRTTQFAPPGGKWFYRLASHPSVEFSSLKSLREVEYRVVEFCRLNRLEVPERLHEAIQDYMCARLPPGTCVRPPDGRRTWWSFFEITKATERSLNRVTLQERVNERQHDEQALVCRTCQKNSLAQCSTCTGLQAQARSRVGAKESKLDPYLGVCECTGCVLAGLTWLTPQAAAKRAKAEVELPPICWMNYQS